MEEGEVLVFIREGMGEDTVGVGGDADPISFLEGGISRLLQDIHLINNKRERERKRLLGGKRVYYYYYCYCCCC